MSTPKPRIIYLTAPAPVPSAEDIAKAFAALGKDSKLWAALRCVIQQRAADAMVTVADGRLSDSERAHAAGRLDETLSLAAEISAMVEGKQ